VPETVDQSPWGGVWLVAVRTKWYCLSRGRGNVSEKVKGKGDPGIRKKKEVLHDDKLHPLGASALARGEMGLAKNEKPQKTGPSSLP